MRPAAGAGAAHQAAPAAPHRQRRAATVAAPALALSALLAGAAGAEPLVFALGEARYRIDLPPEACLRLSTGTVAAFELRCGTRSPPMITLGPPRDGDPPPRRHAVDLPEVGPVRYDLETGGGGSGGAEAWLDGDIVLSGRAYRLSCTVQREHPAPRPEDAAFCLAPLASLRPAN